MPPRCAPPGLKGECAESQLVMPRDSRPLLALLALWALKGDAWRSGWAAPNECGDGDRPGGDIRDPESNPPVATDATVRMALTDERGVCGQGAAAEGGPPAAGDAMHSGGSDEPLPSAAPVPAIALPSSIDVERECGRDECDARRRRAATTGEAKNSGGSIGVDSGSCSVVASTRVECRVAVVTVVARESLWEVVDA